MVFNTCKTQQIRTIISGNCNCNCNDKVSHRFLLAALILVITALVATVVIPSNPISSPPSTALAEATTTTAGGVATTATTAGNLPTGTPGGTYTYYVPVVANGGGAGGITTYLTIHNTGGLGSTGGGAGTQAANVSITYYNNSGGQTVANDQRTLAPYAEWTPTIPFTSGQASGSAVISSSQALNVLVSSTTSQGSGTYTVPVSANAFGGASLPIMSNSAFGIVSRYYLYNPNGVDIKVGLFVTSQYGQDLGGTGGPFNRAYTFRFVIPAHTTYIFDPSTNPVPVETGDPTPMPVGYYGYASVGALVNTITYTPGTATNPLYLVSLLQEYRNSDHFFTLFDYNGLANYQSSTLYIPAVFKDAYGGFSTGMSFSPANDYNPNLIIRITYYDANGNVVLTTTSPNLYYGSMYSVFTGSLSGLPDGFAGSAIATITTPSQGQVSTVQLIVNEQGSASRNGVYMGMANDFPFAGYKQPFPFTAPYNPQVTTLPVLANGGYGGSFYSGFTVQNLLSQPTTFTLTYRNTDGTPLAGAGLATKSYTLAPHASAFVYQGPGGGENLPTNWLGQAVIIVTSSPPPFNSLTGNPAFSIVAQANVQSSFAFYTYSQPGNFIQ